MKREVVIIGGGPAGLAAAIEAKRDGCDVLLVDENRRAGGQLFKQLHKFFGSRAHRAGVRGIDIGKQLLMETEELGIDFWLNSACIGIFPDNFKRWKDRNCGGTEASSVYRRRGKSTQISWLDTPRCDGSRSSADNGECTEGASWETNSDDRIWKCRRDCCVPASSGRGGCRRYCGGDAKDRRLWCSCGEDSTCRNPVLSWQYDCGGKRDRSCEKSGDRQI